MSSGPCTSEETLKALAYLRHAFGGFDFPPEQERAYARLFARSTPAELRQAIDELVEVGGRRPSPADIGERLRMIRRRPELPEREPWPERDPDVLRRGIELCRQKLAERREPSHA